MDRDYYYKFGHSDGRNIVFSIIDINFQNAFNKLKNKGLNKEFSRYIGYEPVYLTLKEKIKKYIDNKNLHKQFKLKTEEQNNE